MHKHELNGCQESQVVEHLELREAALISAEGHEVEVTVLESGLSRNGSGSRHTPGRSSARSGRGRLGGAVAAAPFVA